MANTCVHKFWCDICKKSIKGNKAEKHSLKHLKKGDLDKKMGKGGKNEPENVR